MLWCPGCGKEIDNTAGVCPCSRMTAAVQPSYGHTAVYTGLENDAARIATLEAERDEARENNIPLTLVEHHRRDAEMANKRAEHYKARAESAESALAEARKALRMAENEMRYAGWDTVIEDNRGRFDTYQALVEAINAAP